MNDFIVIGGGMLGAAISSGLSRKGQSCLMLDSHDLDFRAATGNFGLVWVQSKGIGCPEYARWTRMSTKLWPDFARQLQAETGIDVQFEQKGGVHYCLTEDELAIREQQLSLLAKESDQDFSYEMLNNKALKELEPAVGDQIPGGSYSPLDGHVNPLLLLRAMHAAFVNHGGVYKGNHRVSNIRQDETGYTLNTANGEFKAKNLILTAGLDNQRLAQMIGLQQPVIAQRGQVLITERMPRLLNYPSNYLRQTHDGTIQLGDSKENVGLNVGQDVAEMAKIAQRACLIVPKLKNVRIVRGWGALRVLSDDGYPIYEQANNAWAFSSHSGVTLAAIHSSYVTDMIINKQLASDCDAFSAQRF